MADFFCYENGKLARCDAYPEKYGIGFVGFGEVDCLDIGVDGEKIKKLSSTKYTTYAKTEDCNYIVLNIPSTQSADGEMKKVFIHCDVRGILVFCEDGSEFSGLVNDFGNKVVSPCLPSFLACFLLGVLSHDYIRMEGVEKELGEIETKIISSHTPYFPSTINKNRRRIAVLKRYYEQFFELSCILVEEEWLSSAKEEFEKIKEKLTRLRSDSMYLRDYMSQIREAYQQALDLSLNSVMKFLSAVTLIFSPLTFLVGWYGMNFEIPETNLENAYAIPIVLAITIIIFAVWLFKRKKWL